MVSKAAPVQPEERPIILAIIDTFIQDPPDSEFQRGYLCALMDIVVEDPDMNQSDTFNQALELFSAESAKRYQIRRARVNG
jgi:hypothetical protein